MVEKKDDKRSFIVTGSSINKIGGRYMSTTPYGAAKKAATQQFRKAKKGVKEIKILLKESSNESDHHVYFYKATREKLAVPTERVIKIKGVERVIKNEYTTKLEKCNTGAHQSLKRLNTK
jgi:hypothetical protein